MPVNCRIPLFYRNVCNRCWISKFRTIHDSKILASQLSPTVIRQKRAKDRLQSNKTWNDNIHDRETSLPPFHLLEIARKTGALSLEPEQVLSFLRRYQSHVVHGLNNKNWQQKLCTGAHSESEFHITSPRTLTLIAAILRRCKTRGQQVLGRTLILSASDMGDKLATFEIVASALRSNQIHEFPEVISRLKRLATNDGDQKAMMLLGKVLFYTSRSEKESLLWLRKANYPPTGNLEFDGAGESLVLEGRILKRLGRSSDAKIAFEKAAKELNEPEGYFYLSQMEENASSIQQDYLLQSATAGITEAWYNLGVIELDKIQKRKSITFKTLEDFGMAREWFSVAAYDGNGLSMLNMAIMCKTISDLTQAFEWLEKAKSVPAVSVEAERMWQEWKKG